MKIKTKVFTNEDQKPAPPYFPQIMDEPLPSHLKKRLFVEWRAEMEKRKVKDIEGLLDCWQEYYEARALEEHA